MHCTTVLFSTFLVAATAGPQYYAIVGSGDFSGNGLTPITLSPPNVSSAYWSFEVTGSMQGGSGSALGTSVVSDDTFYWMASSQYFFGIIERVSLRTGAVLPPITVNIASVKYPVVPMTPQKMAYDKGFLIIFLNDVSGEIPPEIVSIDLSQARPPYNITWGKSMLSRELKVSYSDGKFIIAESSDPFISFSSIDCKTGAVALLNGPLDCAGAAHAFKYSSGQIVGVSSHYFATNQNQLSAFNINLTTGKCVSQKLALPLDFFPWSYVVPDSSRAYFMNVQEDTLLYTLSFADAKVSSSVWGGSGQVVRQIVNNF